MSKSIAAGLLCLVTSLVIPLAPRLAQAQEPDKPAPPGAAPPTMSPEAQEAMEAYTKAGTPGKQHKWLAGKAGAWEYSGKFWMDPSQPPVDAAGTAERSVLLGGRVLAETVKSEFMGQPFEGYGLTGYDNIQQQFWSTWSDNMSTHVIFSTGTCDDQGECTLSGEYPDAVSGKTKTMRVVSRDEGPDKEVHEAFDVGPDGKEHKSMELVYTRKK